jgi:hypothetical protein
MWQFVRRVGRPEDLLVLKNRFAAQEIIEKAAARGVLEYGVIEIQHLRAPVSPLRCPFDT